MKRPYETWRQRAAPVIAEVIHRVGFDDPARLKRELRDAYPFGDRENYPYKVWLDEIKKQTAPPPQGGLFE